MIDDHHRIAIGKLGGIAERQRRRRQRHDGAHEAESRRVVVRHHARGKDLAPLIDEAHFVRLDDQVADRDDESVVPDDDAGALAFLSERRAAARIGNCPHAHLEDRLEEPFAHRGPTDSRTRLWRRRVRSPRLRPVRRRGSAIGVSTAVDISAAAPTSTRAGTPAGDIARRRRAMATSSSGDTAPI